MKNNMEDIVNFCKQYGFVFPGSEIYGGLANAWDFGPLGRELKENIKKLWWKRFIQENRYNYGLDAAILMNPKVWVASGHVASFADPLIDCRHCKSRQRADKLIEDYFKTQGIDDTADGWSDEELTSYIKEHNITNGDELKAKISKRKIRVKDIEYDRVNERIISIKDEL